MTDSNMYIYIYNIYIYIPSLSHLPPYHSFRSSQSTGWAPCVT